MENPIVIKKFSEKAVMDNNLAEAVFDMTANQLKLFNNFVSLINKDDDDFKEYIIDKKVLTDIFGVNNPDGMYEVIGRAMDNLLHKVVMIKNKEKRTRIGYPVFGKIEYKDGILKFSFNSYLKPFLLQLKQRFTIVLPKYLKSMQSKYSIRLYMLLSQFAHIGTREIDLQDLREILGIENKEYKLFYDFRRKVLDVAQKELEDTPMAFSFITKKASHGKVVSIKFVLKHKHSEIEDTDNPEIDQQPQIILEKESNRQPTKALPIEQLIQSARFETKDSGISQLIELLPQEQRTQQAKEMLEAYLEKYDTKYIRKQIEYTNKQKPRSYFAYLIKAIENNYANYDAKLAEEERIRRQKIFEKELQRLEKEREHDIEADIFSEESRIYREYLNALDPKEKQELIKKYTQLVKEAMPEVEENTGVMDFQVERFITKDIIAKNEIYQIRIAKARAHAEKEAQVNFERGKRKLMDELINNDL